MNDSMNIICETVKCKRAIFMFIATDILVKSQLVERLVGGPGNAPEFILVHLDFTIAWNSMHMTPDTPNHGWTDQLLPKIACICTGS